MKNILFVININKKSLFGKIMDEDTSVFFKKYQQILKFKAEATKKNKIIDRYKIKTSDSTNDKNKLNVLPNININRNNISSQMNSRELSQKNKKEKYYANEKNKYKMIKINSKEYRDFIIEQGDISPKKNIKIIDDNFYNRLQKKGEIFERLKLNNSADDTKLNSSIENNKPTIKLPFLINVKSRYKDNIVEKNRRELLDRFLVDPEKQNIKIVKKSKSLYKNKLKKRERKNYYLMVPGNNSVLVEKCLITRPNWIKIKNENDVLSCNLIWTELSQQINFSLHGEVCLLQIINHFECHNEISNKKNLFENLIRYCEYNKLNLFSFFPLTIILDFKKDYLNEQIEGFKQFFNNISSFIEGKNKDSENSYTDFFRVNILKNVGSKQKIILPNSSYTGKNLWLLKRTNLNRGREIKIFSDLNNILNEIETAKKENKYNHLIIQKYIEDPCLYLDRKFDIRIWVLFTYLSKDYRFEVYVFKEGHLKACSETFNINSDDLFVHLTNYSVQKYNKNFSKIEIGNEISFESFQNELDKRGDGKNFVKNVLPKIFRIIAISANASKNKINILNRKNCFEIFGYDFILDKNLEPFLLEINTNPGLEESSPLIEMLVPRMIDDAFRLTVDEIFEREDEDRKISKFKVDGYTDEENMWQSVNLII